MNSFMVVTLLSIISMLNYLDTSLKSSENQGFIAQKRCDQWEVITSYTDETGNEWTVGMTASGPGVYDKTPDGFPYTGKTDRPIGSHWKCTRTETITPGQINGGPTQNND